MATGCWASSGYSVQGCAQLEQKLRQCMDAPVCSPPQRPLDFSNLSSSETTTRRRTTSTTTSRECTPRLSAPTSGTRSCALVFVYYVYPRNSIMGELSRWHHRQALWLRSLYINESSKSGHLHMGRRYQSATNLDQLCYVQTCQM